MSGSTIGGFVGAAIGFWFGGPAGAQWGWMIGSAVGGYVDPEVIQGPRLQDARIQTSRDGVAIPFGWGVFPCAGNVIWQQADITEHVDEERQGKGGPVVETYTYTRSYAIGICRGEINGLLQVKRNGKLVYDARDDDTLTAEYIAAGMSSSEAVSRIQEQRAQNGKFLENFTLYPGSETQLPDPTIEGYMGAGDVPAYRGLAYCVLANDDVTESYGAIPQYEFVVAACGTSAISPGTGRTWIAAQYFSGTNSVRNSPDGVDWSAPATGADGFIPDSPVCVAKRGRSVLFFRESASFALTTDNGATWTSDGSCPAVATTAQAVNHHGYWFVSESPNGCIRAGDDMVWTRPAVSGDDSVDCLTSIGIRLLGIQEFGTPGHVRYSDDDGETWDNFGFLPNAFNLSSNTRLDNDGLTIGCICVENGNFGGTGSTDRRAHILLSEDEGENWREAALQPFPDLIDQSVTGAYGATGTYIHYAHWFGKWIVAFKNRIAYGSTLDLLTLSAHVFPEVILGIDSDRRSINVCGEGGMIERSTDGVIWSALDTGSTQDIFAIASLTSFDDDTEIPDSPGSWIDGNGDIVAPPTTVFTPCISSLDIIASELCEMEGLTSAEYDVSLIEGIPVRGFRVANEGDAASALQAAMNAHCVDIAEWDGKLRFVPRGGESVYAINGDDLVERDGDPFERERIQEAELLRRATVGYVDPSAGFGPTTQKYERRAGTVRAVGEASVELPMTLSADEAATIAKKRVLVAWGEPEKNKFSLPYRLACLTPTDIVTYTDEDSEVFSLRLMQIEDDGGIREIEASQNCAEAYGATATGVSPKPPMVVNTTLRGPTLYAVMDLPLFRSTEPDTLGLYLAAKGQLSGWTGAQFDYSTDGGATYSTVAQVSTAANFGPTTTDLTADTSPTSAQTLTVRLPRTVSSVSYETLLRYNNRAALQNDSGTWEIIQYQTVTALGDDEYQLSGLIRGRHNTPMGVVTAGATFVVLDAAVQFVPVDSSLLGSTLTLRATTYKTSADASAENDYEFAEGYSQQEWPPHSVAGERDGSDNVTVTWIGRGRIGTEVAPRHSVHFGGYRVAYSDGVDTFTYDVSDTASHLGLSHTYTAAMQTADFGSVPGSLSVSVYALNSITGASQPSETISV